MISVLLKSSELLCLKQDESQRWLSQKFEISRIFDCYLQRLPANLNMFPDVELQPLDAIVPDKKPIILAPGAHSQLYMPVAVIDDRAFFGGFIF